MIKRPQNKKYPCSVHLTADQIDTVLKIMNTYSRDSDKSEIIVALEWAWEVGADCEQKDQ
jgi:hypothetical protein